MPDPSIQPSEETEPPSGKSPPRRWRPWHEREIPMSINGQNTPQGINITIDSQPLKTSLSLEYPNKLWQQYPKDNQIKLLDNLTYIFTAHLPFLLKETIRLEYNTGYPHAFSWTNHCFIRHLPAYSYLYGNKPGTKPLQILKTLLNSNCKFTPNYDIPPTFPETEDENVIIPFTFGKDSFLTYHLAKELNLNPLLIWYDDPPGDGYEAIHKQKLFKQFSQIVKDPMHYLINPLGKLRDSGMGWFGWEVALTSWALMSLPFAYKNKAGYIIFSNEASCNSFFYDQNGCKVIPDYEQSSNAMEEISLLTQALSEGEVYTTTFLQGLNDLAIIAILKHRYYQHTFKHLMSCWSDEASGAHKRWCGNCSKCARLYVYLTANGINPQSEAGFEDNMFNLDKEPLYNVFGTTASGTGWDAFGLNTAEQSLAFYLTHLRGYKGPLIKKFLQTENFQYTKQNFTELIQEYYSLHPEQTTPLQWKDKIQLICTETLQKAQQEIHNLKN